MLPAQGLRDGWSEGGARSGLERRLQALSLAPSYGNPLGLFSTYTLKMLLGVFGEGERETELSLDLLQHPWLAYPAIFSSTRVVTEHWAALGTQHRTRAVHAGAGTHVGPREQGTRHPEEHANREDPCRSKDATTRQALMKHDYLRKSYC